jgi:pimeloyl-ACP methyl ester carboxylesterase
MLNRLLTVTAAQVDRVVRGAAVGMLSRHRAAGLSHEGRVDALKALATQYGAAEYLQQPATFFSRGVAAHVQQTHVDTRGPMEVHQLRWPSAYTPFNVDVAPRYLRDVQNHNVHARLYTTGETGRPAVVVIHGFLCGQWALEERLWPLQRLMRWGMDVALLVLPFHAVRGRPGLPKPGFPGADPRVNIEGFRQSIHDLGALRDWLRQRGAPTVGVMGMSLGGYVSALAATLDPYDFVVPMIPLGSIADFARDGGRLGSTPDEEYTQHRWMDAAHHVVSPLARPSLVPAQRAMVITGEGDRITPAAHAQRLAQHLNARLHVLHGGHLLQFWRTKAFRAVGDMLLREGLRHTSKPHPAGRRGD